MVDGGKVGKKVYKLRFRKVDFLNQGFTEECVGCQALISGAEARGHTEACRERMNKALENTDEGRIRRERKHKRENEALAKHLEKEFGGNDEERSRKVARQVEQATGSERPKRKFEDDVQDRSAISSWENVSTKSQKGLILQRGQKMSAEDEEKDMEVSIMERTMQEDMRWDMMEVCDMCMPDNEDLRRSVTDMKYFDENTWEELDPERVAEGQRAELVRFKKMGVYDYETRAVAMNDELGKFVKVKWVRTNNAMDPEVRCRLVAQELGYGQRMDELFAGTPSLMAVKLILHYEAKGRAEQGIMVLDVKCAFLYGQIRRRVYIELLQQDSRSAHKSVVVVLRKAMFGTRDAPQIWQEEVGNAMRDLRFELSILQSVKEKYDLKYTILSRDSERSEVPQSDRQVDPLWIGIGRG